MAKHIPFGDAVNQAESWAFNLLKTELPDDYLLLTNVEIPTHTGQAMEVDALVVGHWGVYVVDVKGYTGTLDVGQHAWSLDGKEVENALAKANYVSRVLAGNLKKKVPVGVFPPWCQGMVFVTGRQGDTIELNKGSDQLSVYTPVDMIAALTEPWGLTSQHRYAVNDRQKQHVLDTIGQVALVEKRQHQVQDFTKQQCLYNLSGLEIWSAQYNLAGWKSDWLLKILVATEFDSKDDYRQQVNHLNAELQRLQALAGCSGVPHCAPLINDGEQTVLPIRKPAGVPWQLFDVSGLERDDLLRTLRRAATSLQQIHAHGYAVSNWQDNQVFISGEGEVEFIDIANTASPSGDITGFAQCFSAIADALAEPLVGLWFARAKQNQPVTLDELRAECSGLLSDVSPLTGAKRPSGNMAGCCDEADAQVINHRYQLLNMIRQSDHSEIWQAQHLVGQFTCCVSLYQDVDQRWLGLSDHYRRLKNLYHPNIERIIELGYINGGKDIFLSREWVQGDHLRNLRADIEPKIAAIWFEQLLGALQYLHSFEIYHGGISLKNIVCDGNKATLVNFGLGLEAIGSRQMLAVVDEEIWSLEGGAKRDMFALVASFIVALSKDEFPEKVSLPILRQMLQGVPEVFFATVSREFFEDTLHW